MGTGDNIESSNGRRMRATSIRPSELARVAGSYGVTVKVSSSRMSALEAPTCTS